MSILKGPVIYFFEEFKGNFKPDSFVKAEISENQEAMLHFYQQASTFLLILIIKEVTLFIVIWTIRKWIKYGPAL